MANPTLTLFSGANVIGTNDDWPAGIGHMFALTGSFGLEANSRDAALLTTLAPGSYTVQVRGATAADGGEVLAEVYFVD